MLKKASCIIICVFLLISISGCENKAIYSGENTGMTCGNAVMGGGQFAYSNGFVYFYYANSIYEYDLQTKKTVMINTENTLPKMAFLSDDYIYYVDSLHARTELKCITKNGKKQYSLFDFKDGIYYPFADGMDIYLLSAGKLIHRDMSTGENRELISSVKSYYIDDSSIYVVIEENNKQGLYQSRQENIQFNKLELSFEPMLVYSTGTELYLAEKCYTPNNQGLYTCQIIRYSTGQETRLPIYSQYYQILNNCVIYSDDNTYQNSCFTVKSYDLETGEETVLCNNVFDFCILEEKYICFRCQDNSRVWWDLLDWQTGETVRMHQLT